MVAKHWVSLVVALLAGVSMGAALFLIVLHPSSEYLSRSILIMLLSFGIVVNIAIIKENLSKQISVMFWSGFFIGALAIFIF